MSCSTHRWKCKHQPVSNMTKHPLMQSTCAECWINGHKRIRLWTKGQKQTRSVQGNVALCSPSCGLTVPIVGTHPSGIDICVQSEFFQVVWCLLVLMWLLDIFLFALLVFVTVISPLECFLCAFELLYTEFSIQFIRHAISAIWNNRDLNPYWT